MESKSATWSIEDASDDDTNTNDNDNHVSISHRERRVKSDGGVSGRECNGIPRANHQTVGASNTCRRNDMATVEAETETEAEPDAEEDTV